jgi:hypothetical protein
MTVRGVLDIKALQAALAQAQGEAAVMREALRRTVYFSSAIDDGVCHCHSCGASEGNRHSSWCINKNEVAALTATPIAGTVAAVVETSVEARLAVLAMQDEPSTGNLGRLTKANHDWEDACDALLAARKGCEEWLLNPAK